jgi:hypothetical protein
VSRAPRETLDETIDRVAAALTVVPADPGFSERLMPRLASETRWTPRSLVFATAAAAVVLLAMMMMNRREDAPIVQTAAAPSASPAPAFDMPTSEPAAIAETRPSTTLATSSAENVEAHDHELTAGIAALTPPDSLTVEHLAIPHLAIDAVEVERLEVPTLQIAALAITDENKE